MITKDFDLNDVFLMSEIIEKMDLDVDVDKVIRKSNVVKLENKKDASALGKEVMMSVGVDLVSKLVKNLHKAQKEVKRLIANLTGKSVSEVEKMGLKELKQFFTDLIEHEGFSDFLSQLEK